MQGVLTATHVRKISAAYLSEVSYLEERALPRLGMSQAGIFRQALSGRDVYFGSLADIGERMSDVRLTPKS